MGAVVLRVDRIILWGGLFLVGGFLLIVISWVVDPTGALGAIVVVFTWAIALVVVLATRERRASLREPLDRSDPMPGPIGLFRTELPDSATPRPAVMVVSEPPPSCPQCHRPSKVGELTCANCGTSLWKGGPTFAPGATGKEPR